jgi:hypothetical protein
MKIAVIFLAALPALCQQQGFDFSTLDKLGTKARESTNISLEGDTLKAAMSLMGSDSDKDAAFLKNLKSVQVHSYEFDKEGQYDPADLTAVRAYIKSLKWSKIVDVKEDGETTEIYLQSPQNNQSGGLAVVSAEAKEVTVIVISGSINLSDVGKLEKLGLPSAVINHDGKKSEATKKD